MFLHRNSQKRIPAWGGVYHITFVTHRRYPYFKNSVLCELFVKELAVCKALKGFRLYAFCVLYDHVHLLVEPAKEYDISHVMQSLKKEFSRDANRIVGGDVLGGAIPKSRLRGLQKRFHKRYVYHLHQWTQSHRCNGLIPIPFKWQKSFHDHIIRNKWDLWRCFNYVTYNFVRHGYAREYPYTSLRIRV